MLVVVPLPAQTLKLAPAAAARGERVDLELSLESPAGREPSTLQWETAIPAQLSLVEGFPQPGPAAREADKSVSCGTRSQTSGTHTFVCLVFGGRKPVRNGVIAKFSFRVTRDAPVGPAPIRLSRGVAVSADLQRKTLRDAKALVTIRAR